jgi:hypothetical protein
MRTTKKINKDVTLVYDVDELVTDISQQCLLIGKAIERQGRDAHDVKDIEDDNNREIMLNLVSRYFYDAVNMLSPYSKVPIKDKSVIGNEPDDADKYTMILQFHAERSQTTILHLRRLIHDYIVNNCVYKWVSKTTPDYPMNIYLQEITDTRDAISSALVAPYIGRVSIKPYG